MIIKNNEVVNDLLGYPGLKIIQRPDMFNFSLDSTILAYFVGINKTAKKIIDLGCGNGYVPIFLSLRTDAIIHGVEIQEESFDLAKRSVELNKLDKQINIYLGDMKEIHKELGVAQYDVVTSNPPYFKYVETSNVNDSDYQTIARHEVYANLDDVVKTGNILLKDGGTFAMVHRAERIEDIITSFNKYNFSIKRIRFVYPKVNSDYALAILIEAKKKAKPGGVKILPPLYVQKENNTYTDEILKIFNYKKDE